MSWKTGGKNFGASSDFSFVLMGVCQEGPEGVKWDLDWPKIWVGKWDLIHWDWDFCTGNGTQNIKWEWEFCLNPLSKKDFFRIKFKQKSNNSVMEFYPIKK